MVHSGEEFGFLLLALILLFAVVASAPLAKRLHLSIIVAYIAAGIVIGPFGVGVFRSPQTIIAVSEIGVVLLLFVIGLELELSRLLAMRRDIFLFGAAQLVLTGAIIGGLGYASGLLNIAGACVAGLSLALSATAIALRILEDRGDLHRTYGQRAFAVLLFQDMSVVPLLALVPLLAPGASGPRISPETLWAVGKAGGAVAIVILAGRFLLNRFFRLLAETGAREVMTAAALLVVLGTALLMQAAGMSMALGAFLAGLLLAESSYRHELEADIEPFRGLLLALFFMGVGMGIDLDVARSHAALILAAAVILTVLKMGIVWALFRGTCARDAEALRAGSVLTGAGEFAFVLLPLGMSVGVLSRPQGSLLAAIAATTMLLGPPTAALTDRLLRRFRGRAEPDLEDFGEKRGTVLVIGFGRFGQIASQCLLAEELDVTIIDNSAEMIRDASRFGFKIYYGDGARLDVLRAAGAADARLIAICVDGQETTNRIVDIIRAEFPDTTLGVRSFDRRHTLELIEKGVAFEMRETYESAIGFGRKALEHLGIDPERAQAIEDDVRARDRIRFALQQAGDLVAGAEMMRPRRVQPEPLREPERPSRPLNEEARDILTHETEFSG